ncbi:MAG: GNAT family N-acetyltransferase [Pseudomonadota bacterium]
MSKLDILVTRRLTLRPPLDVDAEPMAMALANPNTARMLTNVPNPYGVEDALQFIRSTKEDGAYFSIYRQRFLGMVSIRPAHGHKANLGFWLEEPSWGQGYMSEASRAVVSWYFSKTGIEAIQSGYYEDNSASAAVLNKLGFQPTGETRHDNATRKTSVKTISMELTQERFNAIYGEPSETVAA